MPKVQQNLNSSLKFHYIQRCASILLIHTLHRHITFNTGSSRIEDSYADYGSIGNSRQEPEWIVISALR